MARCCVKRHSGLTASHGKANVCEQLQADADGVCPLRLIAWGWRRPCLEGHGRLRERRVAAMGTGLCSLAWSLCPPGEPDLPAQSPRTLHCQSARGQTPTAVCVSVRHTARPSLSGPVLLVQGWDLGRLPPQSPRRHWGHSHKGACVAGRVLGHPKGSW